MVHYNSSGVSDLIFAPQSIRPYSGASIVANGNSQNIRSGDPGDNSLVALKVAVQDASHAITGLSFTYQYVAGYGAAGAPGGSSFDIVVADECGNADKAILYSSPVLSGQENGQNCAFDSCNTCYCDMSVVLPAGSFTLPVTNNTILGLRFHNNQRNVQVNLPADLQVLWA